jgi:DNA transposition AAA+ family ATPase
MNSIANLPARAEIKCAVNQYCKEKGISKADFGIKSGVSDATLSNLETERFEKLSDAMLLKIWNFCNRNKVESLYSSTDFVSTYKLCDTARQYHFMVGLIADTGMGKTTAISAYSRRKNVFYVSYDKTMNAKQFFFALLKELSYPFESNLNDMINDAAEKLNELESPLVIIDEAGKLNQTLIMYLQVLRDKTSGNCGIVLSGMPYFKDNLIRMANKEKEGYAEFLRRINIWHTYLGLQPKEIEEVCKNNGITDLETIRSFRRKRRFGDLMNEIYLEKIMKEEM